MDDAPKRTRRWFQHSLRWPLLFAVLPSLLCSWFGVKMEYAGKQKAAVEEIENLGGLVWYDYQRWYRQRKKLGSLTCHIPQWQTGR